MVAPTIADVTLGAFASDATQTELRTLHSAVLKLEIMLRQYSDGTATPTREGRFAADSTIQTQAMAVLEAIEAAYALEMPLNPVV